MINKKIPRIENINTKKLVGNSIEMSLIDNKTFELFSGFMPNKKNIQNTNGQDIYEVSVYNTDHFKKFNPNTTFEKWATVEVSEFTDIPDGMKTKTIEGGLYAVFNYKGLAKDFGTLMRAIFTEWLPTSGYVLDARAHFNVLGDKYKHNHPDSEEEVWIPIKLKAKG